MSRALNPGFYYVARLRIESDQDESAVNNTAEISFFVEENGSVTTSGGGLGGNAMQTLQGLEQAGRGE